jgi:hypothetical protein
VLVRVRVALVIALTLVLAACRVDIKLQIDADDDGAGRIAVTVDLDSQVVSAVPGLIEDLRVEDLLASGWTIEGPTQINNGGIRVVLSYEFESPDEATRALRQINGPNGPLLDPVLKRTVDGRDVATTFDASLQFIGGVEAFSDPELSSLIGAAPWQSTIDTMGVDPMQSVSFTVLARLPGEIRKSTGTEAEGGVVWAAPLDGSSQAVVLGTVETKVDGGVWKTIATVVGIVLGVWLVLMGLLILLVMFARRRRGVSRRAPIRRRPSRDTPDA